MAYRVQWAKGDVVERDRDWRPCFYRMSLAEENIQPQKYGKFTVWFSLINDEGHQDFSKHFFNSNIRLNRWINYWVTIGRRCGLNYDNLKWEIQRDGGAAAVRFVFDLSYMKDLPKDTNFLKLLQLHLFFLRYFNERFKIVHLFMHYRRELLKKYPRLNYHTLWLIFERSITDTPTKKGLPRPGFVGDTYTSYYNYGHALVQTPSLKTMEETLKQPSMFARYMAKRKSDNFEHDVWQYPRGSYAEPLGVYLDSINNIVKHLFKEEEVNEKKATSSRRPVLRKAVSINL